jgi:hypothetical protein
MLALDEFARLNIALLFLETMLDTEHDLPASMNELAEAAHSYVQSVTVPDCPPSPEAQEIFCKIQAGATIAEAKRRAP